MFQVAPSMVKIEAVNRQGGYHLGSGVVVAPGKVVTNCHVTRQAVRVNVLWGGLRYLAARQSADSHHDLCVLHAPQIEVQPAKLGMGRALRAGEPIQAAGFVGGMGLKALDGEVAALHRLDGGNVIQSNTEFTSGASGGGLFTTEAELIGILTFRLRGGKAHYFSTPIAWLMPLMQDAGVKVAPLVDAVAFWEAREAAALPYFLQVAPLEAGQQWEQLLRLSEQWAGAERNNPEPWFAKADAYAQLKREPDAIIALQRAVQVDPSFELGWYRLAQLYAASCQAEQLRRTVLELERLRSRLSNRLPPVKELTC